MSDSPLKRRIPVTIFKNVGAKSLTEKNVSMLEILDMIEETRRDEKKHLPLIKLATFGNLKTSKGSLRNDANIQTISGIEGDYDAGKVRPQKARDLLKKAGIAAVVVTTTSHQPDSPRWRVYCPLSDEFEPELRTRFTARLNGALGGILGSESFTHSQSYYFGSLEDGDDLDMWEIEGDYIDRRGDLDDDAILPAGFRDKEDIDPEDLIDLDEAHQRFQEDRDSGKLAEALDEALDIREGLGDSLDDKQCRDDWWRDFCWAIHHGSDGSAEGFRIWRDYARQTERARRLKVRGDNVEQAIRTEWQYAKDQRRGGVLGFGTIYDRLRKHGWESRVYASDWIDDEEDDAPPRKKDRKEERPEEDDGPAPIPDDLMTVPGVLGLAVDHYNATSIQTQPQFAVQTALALGSVVLGRHWSTDLDNFTSLYLVNLGATGSGKEFGRKFLSKVLSEAGTGHLMGPAKYASEAAILGELAWKPRHVTVYDEFGRILDSTRTSGNTNLRDAQTLLMSLFGTLDTEARPTAYSTNGKSKEQIQAARDLVVKRPAITVLGLSTPETFFDALSQDDVANGFMNRLLVVHSRQQETVELPRRWKKTPEKLKRWIARFGVSDEADFTGGESPTEVEEPEVVRLSKKAHKRLHQISEEIIELKQEYRPMRLDGMFSRSREITLRIALIVCLSMDNSDDIEPEHLDWSWRYVHFHTMEMVENARKMMGAGPTIRVADHLAELIDEAGAKGMSIRDLARRDSTFDRMDKRTKDEVIYRLEHIHNIVAAKVKGSKGGRPTIRYVHADFVKEKNDR